MFKFNEIFFFNETVENLNCQGCRTRQPIDKKHWQTEVLYYVFWSILSQMRHVCCEIFPKKFVPKFVCSMVKFSMPAILDRILHLASQTMSYGVSYFVRYFDMTPKSCYGLIASYFIPKKMFGIIWINKSIKNDLKLQLFVKILSRT